MWGRRLVAVVMSFAILTLVAGCGGGNGSDPASKGDTPGTSTNASSAGDSEDGASAAASGPKQEFIAQANAVCAKRKAQIKVKGEALFREYGQQGEGRIFGKRLVKEVIVPEFEGEASDLRALEPPPGDSAQIEEIIATIEQIPVQVKTNVSEEEFYPYKKAERLTAEYGISVCGHP